MNLIWTLLYKLSSPRSFYGIAGRLLPWFMGASSLLFAYGLLAGLVLAPPDYQQGDAFRIIYLHVPSAFMSLFVYCVMAFCAVLTLIWRIKLADVISQVSTALGAWFALLALATGSLWGKPMWGTYWIWDARLTSELILLFLYGGCYALRRALPAGAEAARAIAILVLVGFVDIPIIHYSVYWWNTLHQGATLSKFAKPSIAPSMLYPLLAMIAAFWTYYIALLLTRARHEVLRRETKALWAQDLLLARG